MTTREPEGFELLDIDTGETLASLTDIEVFPNGPVVSPDWRYLGSLRGSEAASTGHDSGSGFTAARGGEGASPVHQRQGVQS